MASALQRIATAAGRTVNMPAERNPAAAAMFIINPLSGLRMDKLFTTHPPTEERIARLMAMRDTKTPGPSATSAGTRIPHSGTNRREGPWSD